MEAVGVNGQIKLLADRIRIARKGFGGFITHGPKGEKEIMISELASVEFKTAALLSEGYIQFAFRGGIEDKGWGIALFDENTVTFNRAQEPMFQELRSALNTRMADLRQTAGRQSPLHDLEKLADLRSKGIITEEEFEVKKRRLLEL